MLLLHGFCESSRIFRMLVPSLGARRRILMPELPGHAGVPWDPHWRSLTRAADWLRDYLDEAGVDQCTLVGHSLGGYIAAAFAERYPERLSGVCMLHSTALPDPPERQIARNKALEFIERNGPDLFLKAFVQSLFHVQEPAWLSELEEITSQTDPDAILALIRIMRDRPDRVLALHDLKVPVMYIVGAHDQLVTPQRAQEELGRVGLALLHRLENAGHMGMYEAPEKVIEALRDF